MTVKATKLWEIKHIDLSSPLPNLDTCESKRGIFAFLWWKGIPLGQMQIDSRCLPVKAGHLLQNLLPIITPIVGSYVLTTGFEAPLPDVHMKYQHITTPELSELLSVNRPLHQLDHTVEQVVSEQQEAVSVVVCTRDRPDSLVRCLKSLQSLATRPHELIVVDNAPNSDKTKELVARFTGVQYIREPRPGLSVARNRGIKVATGELIAFTDDDVEVDPLWLERLRIAFLKPGVMATTGLILPARLDTQAEETFQHGTSGFGWGYRPITFDSNFFEPTKPYGVPVWGIGAGANMAFRRIVFETLGGFDERLGAGASGCSEDSEFWYRVLARGWACQYNPLAVVYHHHRVDSASLNQQMRAYMQGHVVALLIQAGRYKHWGNLRRLCISLPYHYGKQIVIGSLHRFRGRYRTVFPEIQGCLMAIPYYFANSNDQHYSLTKAKSIVHDLRY